MEDIPEGLASSGAIEVAEALSSISGGRVLDVATGRGDLIETLIETLMDYETFLGVDVDLEEIEKARTYLEEGPADLALMDATALAIPDGAFDTVATSYSLHHFERLDAVLTEMLRVLRVDGWYIVQDCISDVGQTEAQRTDILKHHWGARIDTLTGTYHRETLTREGMVDVMRGLGLRDMRVLETSHPVKCLFCEDRFKCEDPMDDEFISAALKEIDEDLSRLEAVEDPEAQDRLREEGEVLKDRVRQTGVAPASTVVVIGRK